MAETEQPQIYLITPSEIELSRFPRLLAECLDTVPVACLRLALSTSDEAKLARAADACREVAHGRDVAIVIERHVQMVARLGLDGVHLKDGARSVRKVRKALGRDAIVGTDCGVSRHDGMTAAEADADYVSFGPIGETGLGDGETAPLDLFAWWSELIEVPVVAEGALTEEHLGALAPHVDFFGIGAEIWGAESPASRLKNLADVMARGATAPAHVA